MLVLNMNILFVTPSYFPHRGGTEQVIHELANLLKENHSITILTQKRDKTMSSFETINGVDIYRIRPLPHYLGDFFHYNLKQKQLYKKANELHKRLKFDLVHNFHVYEFAPAVLKLKNKWQVPVITSLMGWDSFDPVKKIPPKHIPAMTDLMNSSEAMTSPSTHLANAAKEDQGCINSIQVIPHGTRMFDAEINKSYNIREKYRIPESATLFLSVQRIDKRKGLQYLISAIPQIIKFAPHAHFLITGKGPEMAPLKALAHDLQIEERISWTGFVADDELPSIYKESNFFILPSLYEAFGLVYADALSFGLPVLSTKNGGTMDILSDVNGVIFDMHSSDSIVKATKTALKKNWKVEAIIEDAQKFRWATIAKEYNNIYSKLHK